MRSFLMTALLVATFSSRPAAQSPCLHVPDPTPENYGGAGANHSEAPFAFSTATNQRSLIVIPAIRFANVPRWIDDLAFVPLGTDYGDCDELIVRMSHGSSTAVAGLFAPHLTEPQVEVLRVRSHRFARIANTWLRLGLQRPFLYIPARGNLVIDVIALGARPDPRGLGQRGFAKAAPDVGWAATGTDTLLIPDRGAATPFPKLALCSAAAGLDGFGRGCAGSGGFAPALGLDGSARLGDTVEIWLSNAPASTSSFIMRGLDSVGSTAWARQRRPLPDGPELRRHERLPRLSRAARREPARDEHVRHRSGLLPRPGLEHPARCRPLRARSRRRPERQCRGPHDQQLRPHPDRPLRRGTAARPGASRRYAPPLLMRQLRIAFLFASLALPPGLAQQTIVVQGGGAALQQAIDGANPGDVLDVHAGTYDAVLIQKGVHVVCRSGVSVVHAQGSALTIRGVPAGESMSWRGGELSASTPGNPLWTPVLGVENCAGAVLLRTIRPRLTAPVLAFTAYLRVLACSGPVVLEDFVAGMANIELSRVAITDCAQVVFRDSADIPPLDVTRSNLLLDGCQILEHNSARGMIVTASDVTVRGGSIRGGLAFSFAVGMPAIALESGVVTLTGGARIIGFGTSTAPQIAAPAIDSSGGRIRLDPSAQLVSFLPNPIRGPALVSHEPIAQLGSSGNRSGAPFLVDVHGEPGSLTATFVSWAVSPTATPYGQLWVDPRAPLLDLAVLPAGGVRQLSATMPNLPLRSLLVMQPISWTSAGTLVVGAAATVVVD